MKSSLNALAAILFLSCSAQQPSDNRTKEIIFSNVSIIPMDKDVVLLNQDVVVKNGVIISIGPTAKLKYNKDALVIDGKWKYLVPGLAEMHAHVPPIDDIEPMIAVVKLFALKGVTTIRGMLGHPRHIELRSKIQSGEIIGPRFITSGPSFSGNTVKTPAAAATMVRDQKKVGYDFLKLHPGITK
jgi:hypothetical protein